MALGSATEPIASASGFGQWSDPGNLPRFVVSSGFQNFRPLKTDHYWPIQRPGSTRSAKMLTHEGGLHCARAWTATAHALCRLRRPRPSAQRRTARSQAPMAALKVMASGVSWADGREFSRWRANCHWDLKAIGWCGNESTLMSTMCQEHKGHINQPMVTTSWASH